jgi:hypothetical protein
MFNRAVLPVGILLQLAARDFEGVPDRHVDIFMRRRQFLTFCLFFATLPLEGAVQSGFVVRHDFGARNGQIDADVKLVFTVLVSVRDLDHHAAARNTIVKLFELRRLLADFRPNRL